MNTPRRNTVVIVNNVDVNSQLAALMACAMGMNVRAVIVTGRPAHPNGDAALVTRDRIFSEQRRQLNTRRMKGFLQRAGYNVPVFEGLIPPQTIISHAKHLNEQLLNLHNDHTTPADGQFSDCVQLLDAIDGTIDVIVGGPLTEAAELIRLLSNKLGILACQVGRLNGAQPTSGDNRTLNGAADPVALDYVLLHWPRPVYIIPNSVTRKAGAGCSKTNLKKLRLPNELQQLYTIFWQHVYTPQNDKGHFGPAHPVVHMASLQGILRQPPYTWDETSIAGVSETGEITFVKGASKDTRKRFVINDVDTGSFMRIIRGFMPSP